MSSEMRSRWEQTPIGEQVALAICGNAICNPFSTNLVLYQTK